MDQYPRVGVVGLIRDGSGKVLMQRRRGSRIVSAEGLWEFPGGKVDFGEAPPDALAREVREETGCEVSIGRLLPLALSRIWEDAPGGRMHFIVLCYECWHVGGTPQPTPGTSDAVRWCTPDEIAALDCVIGIPSLMAAAGLGTTDGSP